VLGVLACALTGLLISPISWDHHWVWIAPGLVVLAHYTWRAWSARRRRAAAALTGLTALLLVVFAGRPEGIWLPGTSGIELTGLLWSVPTTKETQFFQLGDRPWFAEYHYHGLQILGGNLFVLAGIGLLALLVVTAIRYRETWRFPCADSTGAPSWSRPSPR
jgi:alpha-1,2-mannosyltransferase